MKTCNDGGNGLCDQRHNSSYVPLNGGTNKCALRGDRSHTHICNTIQRPEALSSIRAMPPRVFPGTYALARTKSAHRESSSISWNATRGSGSHDVEISHHFLSISRSLVGNQERFLEERCAHIVADYRRFTFALGTLDNKCLNFPFFAVCG